MSDALKPRLKSSCSQLDPGNPVETLVSFSSSSRTGCQDPELYWLLNWSDLKPPQSQWWSTLSQAVTAARSCCTADGVCVCVCVCVRACVRARAWVSQRGGQDAPVGELLPVSTCWGQEVQVLLQQPFRSRR